MDSMTKTILTKLFTAAFLVGCSLPARGDDRYSCEWIGIAAYQGYKHTGTAKERIPTTINFHLIQTLIGPKFARLDLPLKNYFTGSDKKFEESIMPKEGSKWIIFLPFAVPTNGVFEAFQGASGKICYSKSHLDDVLDGTERAHPDVHFDTSKRKQLHSEIENF